jgi:hypothetical protein
VTECLDSLECTEALAEKTPDIRTFIADIEHIFKQALQHEKWTVALRAKELLGRLHGFFKDKRTGEEKLLSLRSLSDQTLQHLLKLCEGVENSKI